MKNQKRIRFRIPLPKQTGGPQTTRKGKRGYNRKNQRRKTRQILEETDRNSASSFLLLTEPMGGR